METEKVKKNLKKIKNRMKRTEGNEVGKYTKKVFSLDKLILRNKTLQHKNKKSNRKFKQQKNSKSRSKKKNYKK